MYKRTENNRTVLMIVIFIIVLGIVFGGTYFLLQRFVKNEIFLDKHGDVVSLCSRETGTSVYKCNLLLQDIVPNIEGKTCFDVQIISNDTIVPTRFCEEEQYLTLTNEIVQFKKLKPLTVSFTYAYNKLTNILFEPISDTYIQDLVNKDIIFLTNFDLIQQAEFRNAFDFCPAPSVLPDYVENKSEYTKKYDESILDETRYRQMKFSFEDDGAMSHFFTCYSSYKLGYNNICNSAKHKLDSNIVKSFSIFSINEDTIKWNEKFSAEDLFFLKHISLVYDNLLLRNSNISSSLLKRKTSEITEILTNTESVDVFSLCSLSHFYNLFGVDKNFSNNKEFIEGIIIKNLSKEIPGICYDFLKENIDRDGFYIKQHFTKRKSFNLFNTCFTLNILLENE